MTEVLYLGCGTEIKPDAHNVDKLDHSGVDEVVDLDETPWPWDDESYSKILAEHVFEHLDSMEETLRECERVLKPEGILEIALPIGHDAWVDPDHNHMWNWDTPGMYCGNRPWDRDVGLVVEEKSVDLWPHMPGMLQYLYGVFLKGILWRYEPHRWAFNLPASSGEFRVVFRKP